MNKKIDSNMNLLRIVAIILVILLHSNATQLYKMLNGDASLGVSIVINTISVVTRIAVPLFILISGRYVLASLDKMSIKEFYLKRVPRILYPMVFWSFIFFFISYIGLKGTTILSYLKDFATGFAHNMASIHLWYLFMLLGLYLVSPIIYGFIKSIDTKKLVIVGIILTALGFGVEIIKNVTGINVWVFWWLEFLGLYIMGYATKDIKVRRKSILILFAVAIEIVASAVSCMLLASGNQLGIVFWWGLTPTTTATAILVYMYFSNLNISENKITGQAKYTMGIYLFHPIILMLMAPVSTGVIILDVIVKLVVAYVLSLIIVMGLYKIKFMRKFVS